MMKNAMEKEKSKKCVERDQGEEFAIVYQLLREDLTERVQRPEGKEGTNFRGI